LEFLRRISLVNLFGAGALKLLRLAALLALTAVERALRRSQRFLL